MIKKQGQIRMKKNKALNIIMAVLIVFMFAGALMHAGSLKGWFDRKDESKTAIAKAELGISSIERDGIGFSLSDESALRNGDVVETKDLSSALIRTDKNEKK